MRRYLMIALVSLLGWTISAQGADRVNIMEYALEHPTDNAPLPSLPELGDSVPKNIVLKRPDGPSRYSYFYYDGRPVIVDMKTRAIVRIPQ